MITLFCHLDDGDSIIYCSCDNRDLCELVVNNIHVEGMTIMDNNAITWNERQWLEDFRLGERDEKRLRVLWQQMG